MSGLKSVQVQDVVAAAEDAQRAIDELREARTHAALALRRLEHAAEEAWIDLDNHERIVEQARYLRRYLLRDGDGSCFEFDYTRREVNDILSLIWFSSLDRSERFMAMLDAVSPKAVA